MNCPAASWIFTTRPNSVGLASLPLRMISVCASKRLTTLPGKWVSPRSTRARVCACHDSLDQLDRDRELDGQWLAAWPRRGDFGLADHGPRDPQQAPVEELHPRLALLAYLRGHSTAGGAAALRDLEHPTGDTACAL